MSPYSLRFCSLPDSPHSHSAARSQSLSQRRSRLVRDARQHLKESCGDEEPGDVRQRAKSKVDEVDPTPASLRRRTRSFEHDPTVSMDTTMNEIEDKKETTGKRRRSSRLTRNFESLPYNPSTFDSLTSSLNTTTTSFPPTAVGNDVSHLPTWSIALSKLAPLSTLLGKRRRQKQVVSLIVCVMEVEQSKQLQTKEEKARGMPGTLWIGHWKVTAPPAEGELPVSCGVKLWKEFGEKWGSGAMRKGDVVLLTNVEFNPPSELTVDSRSKPTITILYRTSPSYAGREMKMCPEDRALRPDLRLARSDAALRKVVDFARWFAGEFGGEGPP